MYVAAHRGTRIHAPENTLPALVSGYTSGGQVIEFDLRPTRDGNIVLGHDETADRMTGVDRSYCDLTLAELRALDQAPGVGTPGLREHRGWPSAFRYHIGEGRPVGAATFDEAMRALPAEVPKLIELKVYPSDPESVVAPFVEKAVSTLADHNAIDNCVVYSMGAGVVRRLRELLPELRVCAFDYKVPTDEQLDLLERERADGLVLQQRDVLDDNFNLTEFGRAFRDAFDARGLRVGAVLYPYSGSGVPWGIGPEAHRRMRQEPWIWSCATDSTIDMEGSLRQRRRLVHASFHGTSTDTHRFALGYAKRNRWCQVRQNDGVHVELAPYDGPLPPDDLGGSTEDRVAALERDMLYARKTWPFYSGGGLGLRDAIDGDFIAEVSYRVRDEMTQAVTLEMAVVNSDPGEHQGPWDPERRPFGPSEQDCFFDPHGSPPYVGIEHDENDGYRINWNLGTEYESNRYGRPVGDGTARSGRLRLERRGQHFSVYYKNTHEAFDWICVGSVRNDSLNRQVFLRCVAKRWRQRSGDGFHPIRDNVVTFSDLEVVLCRDEITGPDPDA